MLNFQIMLLIFFSFIIIGVALLVFRSDILEKIFSFIGLIVNIFHNLLSLVVYSCVFILAIIFIISIFE